MPAFEYSALDRDDHFLRGSINARTQRAALKTLAAEGLSIVNLRRQEKNWFDALLVKLQPIRRIDRIFFTRHLHAMIDAGVALDEAVRTAVEQADNPRYRQVLTQVHTAILQGRTFSAALSEHPHVFPKIFTQMIRVGETSGKLDEVVSHLLKQQESDYELVTKTRSSMVYPGIVFGAMVVMVIGMLTFVIPKITGVLSQYDVQLPLATRALIALSHVLTNYGIFIAVGVALLVWGIRRYLRTPRGRKIAAGITLNFPGMSGIVREFNVARMSRALAALLASGVSIDHALAVVGDVVSNERFARSLRDGSKYVQKGVALSEVLRGSPKLYPPLVIRMTAVGEKTGKLDELLAKTAQFYEQSLLTSTRNLSSTVEPILLLTLGLGVAIVALAVLTPIWKFSETI